MYIEPPEVLLPILLLNIRLRISRITRMDKASSGNVNQTMSYFPFGRLAFFSILFGVITCSFSYGQDMEAKKDSVSEPSNIVKYTDFIATRFAVNNNFNSFSVIDDANDLNYDISPNQRLRSIFTIQFRFVDIDIGFTPHFLKFNDDDDLHGKTKFSGMGFRLYLGRWMQQLEWSNTKGFYIDVKQIDDSLQENILFPDLKVFKIGGTTSYVLNSNYSFKAVIKQNEWQRKSSGSFVPSASYTYTRITDDAEIDKIFNFALGPSYHYNLIIADRFLVSAGLFLGLGYNYTLVEFDDQRDDYVINGLLVRSDLKLALGYNSTKFFIGGHVNLNSFSYNLDPKITFVDNQQILEFYIGYRFRAPKKVLKIADDVQGKIGL